MRQIASERPTLYLSFDDGPDSACTPAVLDLLAAHGCRATFFVVGRRAANFPHLVRAMHTAGHSVGSHSWDHRIRSLLTGDARVGAWIARGEAAIQDIIGRRSVGFRPPWGVRPPNLRRAVAGLGLTTYLWNLRFFDSVMPLYPAWARRALEHPAHNGSVVLLHDGPRVAPGQERFLASLAEILKAGRQRGIAFEAIPWN